MRKTILAVTLCVTALTACGDSAEGGDAEPVVTTAVGRATTTTQGVSTTATTPAPTTTTTVAPTTTTTTEAALGYSDLAEGQQELVGRICAWASEPDTYNGDTSMMYIQVVSGEAGVPAMEEAWLAIGNDGEPQQLRAMYFEAALPICDDLGWSASA